MNEKTVGELWSQAQRNRTMREYERYKRWNRILSIAENTIIILFALVAAWCVAQQIKLIGAIVGSIA